MSEQISVMVNGEPLNLPAGSTVADLVVHLGLVGKRLAVERNLEVVPRSEHGSTKLNEGDTLEVVHAIGGG